MRTITEVHVLSVLKILALIFALPWEQFIWTTASKESEFFQYKTFQLLLKSAVSYNLAYIDWRDTVSWICHFIDFLLWNSSKGWCINIFVSVLYNQIQCKDPHFILRKHIMIIIWSKYDSVSQFFWTVRNLLPTIKITDVLKELVK